MVIHPCHKSFSGSSPRQRLRERPQSVLHGVENEPNVELFVLWEVSL